jgi:hypothetical protein
MKTRGLVGGLLLAAALISAADAHTQSKEDRYARYDFNKLMYVFDESLRSDIPGIVESTIYNLVEYKSYFPDRDYGRSIRMLSDIARRSTDPAIAYKASLAGMYLTYGSRIEDSSVFNPLQHEAAFERVAEQLNKKFLLSLSND